jgi:hypothetical protein
MLRVLEPDASMTLDMNGDRPALFKTWCRWSRAKS